MTRASPLQFRQSESHHPRDSRLPASSSRFRPRWTRDTDHRVSAGARASSNATWWSRTSVRAGSALVLAQALWAGKTDEAWPGTIASWPRRLGIGDTLSADRGIVYDDPALPSEVFTTSESHRRRCEEIPGRVEQLLQQGRRRSTQFSGGHLLAAVGPLQFEVGNGGSRPNTAPSPASRPRRRCSAGSNLIPPLANPSALIVATGESFGTDNSTSRSSFFND